MGNSDWERGTDDIYKTKDRSDMGHDVSEQREHFDTGWDLGRRASNPNENTTAREIVDTVDKDYQGLGQDGRKAYRDGFASGANRVQEYKE